MFLFTSNLDSACDMFENTMIRHHAKLVIDYLDKIVILLTTSSSISGQDKDKLIDLGKRHYHFGLKKEHFKVIFDLILYNFVNVYTNNKFKLKIYIRYLKIVLLEVLK
jgi:hypothetical protein